MNKLLLWVNTHKVLSAILTLVLVSYLWYDMPFKATDPASPFFVESLFRLRDYPPGSKVEELRDKVLPELFPVGTAKKYVDLMLIERGGAHIIDQTQYSVGRYVYSYTHIRMALTPDAYNIRVIYDKDGKVQVVNFAGKTVVGKNHKI